MVERGFFCARSLLYRWPRNSLSTMNIPTMNHCLFKRREREVGKAVEIVSRESCEMNLNLEKKVSEQSSGPSTDGLAGIAVSYDMGWQKRGRGQNSSTGHGAAMELTTGKVVSYSTRCKTCRVCSHNKLTGKEKKHDCRKNQGGSSKSMESDVACELWSKVAQTNLGYGYIGKKLKGLNIRPGYYHNIHTSAMDRKVICDKGRKRTKKFKQRRNQLSQQQNSQTLRREASKGTTYESSAGLNLDTSYNRTVPQIIELDVPTELSETELRRYEKLLPPYTARPKVINLPYDPTQKYQFIIFDIETRGKGKQAEIRQLSAVSENGRHEFSTFINGMTIKNTNKRRRLCHRNNPVQSVTIEEALGDFLTFIKQVRNSDEVNNNLTVLIGHNSAIFDVPILLRNSNDNFKDSLTKMDVYFADSLHLMKNLIKNKHKALELKPGTYCELNQSSLYFQLFNEQYNAHDALEDARALMKILFESRLSLSTKDIVENSSVTSVSHAVENMLHLDRRHERLLTFSDKLFNKSDTGPIKRSMALKIAESGLSYDDLHKLYTTSGKGALVCILSNTPTTSLAKTPRVTREEKILASIVKHFEKINHEE